MGRVQMDDERASRLLSPAQPRWDGRRNNDGAHRPSRACARTAPHRARFTTFTPSKPAGIWYT